MFFDSTLDDEPIAVDGRRDRYYSIAQKDVPGAEVAWVFDPYLVAGIEQRAHGNVQSLLGSLDDHDLLWFAANRSHSADVRGDRAPAAARIRPRRHSRAASDAGASVGPS